MQIPPATVRSLAQRPITLDDDEEEEEESGAGLQQAAEAEDGDGGNAAGGMAMSSASNPYDASGSMVGKKLPRSRSGRQSTSNLFGPAEDGAGKSLRRDNGGADNPDDESTVTSRWMQWLVSIASFGRRRAQVVPSAGGNSGKRTLKQSNNAAMRLVSIVCCRTALGPLDSLTSLSQQSLYAC